MALLEVIFGSRKKARVGFVQFDASIQEQHSKSVEVPSHPVEIGSDIADHIRRLPEELTINGVVTNHPIEFLASFRAPSPLGREVGPSAEFTPFGPVEDRVDAAFAELRRVMDAGELVSVVTTLRDYENMAIVGLNVNRDAQNGNVLNAQLTLREVLLASVERVDLPDPVTAANQSSQNLGRKATTPADAPTAEKSTSVLKGLTDFVGGAIFGP